VFARHVVRSTDEGTTDEETVVHLSESEREVTGLVFTLVGYLVHDLHATLPFMVLDSFEALDLGRSASWSSTSRSTPRISSSRCCTKTPRHLTMTTSV
jgi:hypothetical protein